MQTRKKVFKRAVSLLLTVVLMLGMAVTVFAESKTVYLNDNGGSGGSGSVSYTYESGSDPKWKIYTTTNVNIPTRVGYKFNGYYKSTKSTSKRFDENGISLLNSNSYCLLGYNDSIESNIVGTDVGGNDTLYAQWTYTGTYTINYNANGGSGAPSSGTATRDVNFTLPTTQPTRTGYTFAGWNTAQDGSGTTYQSGESVKNLASTQGATVTLYAQWTAATYTVTLNYNDGTGTSHTSYTYGVGETLPTPTRDKYVFRGWFDNEKFEGNQVTAIGADEVDNKTFYAKWLTVTDAHLESGKCDVGGLMGHQYYQNSTEIGRTIIGLTEEMLEEITRGGKNLVIVGGDYGIEATVTIDCAYTYFYNGDQKIEAGKGDLEGIAAFVIIEDNGKSETISGYGYYRLYNGSAESEDNFLFDAMFKDPNLKN